MISSDGLLTTYFVNTQHTSAATWYAIWTRNFTCNDTVGKITNYMGKEWYTLSKSNGQCELLLKGVAGTGTYNNASTGVYNAIKDYTNGTNTFAQENTAGLVDSYDTDGGNNSSYDVNGIYYTGYDSTNGPMVHFYSSTDVNKYKITEASGRYYAGVQQSDYASSGYSTLSNVGYSTNGVYALANYHYTITNATGLTTISADSSVVNISTTNPSCTYNNAHYSRLYSHFKMVGTGASTSICPWRNRYFTRTLGSTSGSWSSYENWSSYFALVINACGGSKDGITAYQMYAHNSSGFYFNNYTTGTMSSERSYTGSYTNYYTAATATGHNVSDQRQYDLWNDASCGVNYNCTTGSKNYTIYYRPHIVVKY